MDPEFWRAMALRDLIPYWAEHAPDPENGAFGGWYDLIETAPPHRPAAKPAIWWWVQIYGSFLQLQLYRLTGDEACLDVFRRREAFFVDFMRDRQQGGVFGSVTPDGRPWKDFDPARRSVNVPAGGAHSVEVTFAPGTPAR